MFGGGNLFSRFFHDLISREDWEELPKHLLKTITRSCSCQTFSYSLSLGHKTLLVFYTCPIVLNNGIKYMKK